jgi:ectoine hydroxylase-related dioxygenase (phytanoyl-CoA dioxygenase family)
MHPVQQAIKEIDTNGYCKLKGIYGSDDIRKAQALLVSWREKTAQRLAASPAINAGHPAVYNLQNKDIFFLRLAFASEEIERILVHYLNDVWYKQIPRGQPNYILRTLAARSSSHAMPLHIDSFVPYLGSHVYSMQFSIVLEDQDESNGCTIVVPGSHLSGEYAPQSALKEAIPIRSKAGDVVVWDSRLWHATTANVSNKTRWAILATFVRWWVKQYSNVTGTLPPDIYEELTDKEKSILGYCSVPPDDEFQRIDIKQGYADLR